MDKVYQMSELEHNAFINHCKSSEIFKKMFLRTYSVHDADLFHTSGEMARQDEDMYYSDSENTDYDDFGCYETDFFKGDKFYIYKKTETIKAKGYDNEKEKRWVK